MTTDQTFDVFGWDTGYSASTAQLRWNATTGRYEARPPGVSDWFRAEAYIGPGWQVPTYYDLFAPGIDYSSVSMFIYAPPLAVPKDLYIGDARVLGGNSITSWFWFGFFTEADDAGLSGTIKCDLGEDEIGTGQITLDFTSKTGTGWVEPFWGKNRYELTGFAFSDDLTAFSARFGAGPEGLLEGRFFGPGAVNVGARSQGGGPGFEAVNGLLLGICTK